MIFIYFAGTMLCFITFFRLESLLYGPSEWTYTCFINDGTLYYAVVDTLLGVYMIMGTLFLCRGRPPRPLSKQVLLYSYLLKKKLYILVFLVSNLWGIVYQIVPSTSMQYIFILMIALQPALFSLLWLLPYLRARVQMSKKPKDIRQAFDPNIRKSFFDLAKEKLM